MQIKDYQEIIGKTAVYPKTVENFDLAYCSLGVLDEIYEFYEKIDSNASGKELKKEAGDIIWYITAICNWYKKSLEDLLSTYNKALTYEAGNIFGPIKKYYRDGKEISYEKMSEILLLPALQLIFKELGQECLPEILQMNYDKLIKRRETNTLHGDGDNRELIV